MPAPNPQNPTCPHCHSTSTRKNGKQGGYQAYRCNECGKAWSDSPNPKGGQCIGDKPKTQAQKDREYRARQRAKGTPPKKRQRKPKEDTTE
jgi:transposase-like protein